jgi:hypothetical protein
MNPTILVTGPYRFFFFSKEELRPHIHVVSSTGEAKFWLYPKVSLAKSYDFNQIEVRRIQKIIEENREEFIKAWEEYFSV